MVTPSPERLLTHGQHARDPSDSSEGSAEPGKSCVFKDPTAACVRGNYEHVKVEEVLVSARLVSQRIVVFKLEIRTFPYS